MAAIKFSPEERQAMANQLREYCNGELGQELGQFDAEFLLDFITLKLGPYFYNRGLYDAQQLLNEKLQDIEHALYELEKPVGDK